MKNIFKNINWEKVSKIIDYIVYGLLIVLLFLAGWSAGIGNWLHSRYIIAFIAVSVLCLYYRGKYRKIKEQIMRDVYTHVENKILKMHIKYYEDNYGKIGEDPKSKEREAQRKKDDKEPPCSAENNDQTAYHNIAEGVGGGDDE